MENKTLEYFILRLSLRRPSGHIANPILSAHRATMGYFNLEAFDFLGELDPLGVVQGLVVFVHLQVQNFA
jgi:hypothetical protein